MNTTHLTAPDATTYWQPHATFGGVIDISHHNGSIKWSQVPADVRMVMVKATQGVSYADPTFAENREGAIDTDRMVVPYHFLTSGAVDAQLRNFADHALLGLGSAAMVDWEVDPTTSIRPPVKAMEDFCAALSRVIGRTPLAYRGMYDLSSPTVNLFPWMVPKYGPQPRGPRWLFWQWTSNAAVPGIPNPTDRSLFAGTLDELREWWRSGKMPASFDAPPMDALARAIETARDLQRQLVALGYDAGPDDGQIGRRSSSAALQAYKDYVSGS